MNKRDKQDLIHEVTESIVNIFLVAAACLAAIIVFGFGLLMLSASNTIMNIIGVLAIAGEFAIIFAISKVMVKYYKRVKAEKEATEQLEKLRKDNEGKANVSWAK